MKAAHADLPKRSVEVPEGILEDLDVDILTGGRAADECTGENVIHEFFTHRNLPQFDCTSVEN